MNKKEFALALSKDVKLSYEQCILVVNILENNFFISANSKNKIIIELMNELNLIQVEAEKVYEVAKEILKKQVIHKIRHPFN